MLNKILVIFIFINSALFAQRNAVFSQNSVLGDSVTIETTYTLNEVVSDSVLLYLLTGYMPIKVDTVSATSNITLATNQELIADSNKWYGTTSGDWVLVGSGDTTVNADSSLTLIDSSSAYIALPVTTNPDYLHTISFNAKSDSANTKAYWSYGSIADSSEVLTATDTLLSINGYGQGTDSLKIWTTANSEITISEPNITKLVHNFKVNKDSTKILEFTPRTDSLGSYSESITVNNIEIAVSWEVVNPAQLLVTSPASDTLDFGTVSALSPAYDTIYVSNPSAVNMIGIFGSNVSPFAFESFVSSNSIIAGGTHKIAVSFTPAIDDTFYATMNITYFPASGGLPLDTISIVITGISSGITSPTLTAPNIIANSIDSTDGISFSWIDSGDELGYRVYGEYDGVGYELLSTQTGRTYSDYPITLTDRNYYIQAYNASTTVNSDTITVSDSTTGNVYYVSSAGSDSDNGTTIGTPWQTIAKLNSSAIAGYKVLFNSGDTLSDAALTAKQNSTYSTYGGSTKAIIGDSMTTNASSHYVINITQSGVTLDNLTIYSWNVNTWKSGRDYAINVGTGNTTIQNCVISGGNGFWAYDMASGIKIDRSNDNQVTIYNNEIKNFYNGIYCNVPSNVEISYNEMHDFWKFQGTNSVGGLAIYSDKGSYSDAYPTNYTFHIHHNDIYNFEHSALWVGTVSEALLEYNYIYNNLDERIYQGGVGHGVVGKFTDDTGMIIGTLKNIFRYNYVYNLKKYGTVGVSYPRPTTVSQLVNRTYTETTKLNGQGYPSYPDAIHLPETADEDTVGSANTIGGGGYGNTFIHNNIFNEVKQIILSRGQHYDHPSDPYNNDYPSYFINNTIYNCGDTYITNDFGVLLHYMYNQAPLFYVNNIVDFRNTYASTALTFNENQTTSGGADYNIFVQRTGQYSGQSLAYSSTTAIWMKKESWMTTYPINWLGGTNNQYNTSVSWTDTSNTITLLNVGRSGVTIPDISLINEGNAYDTGMDYTSINSGLDFAGRSLAYDIAGTLRTTNDIGALGVYTEETIVSPTPTILTQPVSQYVVVGDTATFTIDATSSGAMGYQWWNLSEMTELVEGSKYIGVDNDTLKIADVTEDDGLDIYFCEVKNLNGYPADGYWVNSNNVQIILSDSAVVVADTVYPAANTDDVYRQYSDQLYDFIYLVIGDQYNSDTKIGIRFTGVTEVSLDSAFIEVIAYETRPDAIDYSIYGEDVASPATFSTYSDFDTRIATLTTATASIPSTSIASKGVVYRINVTSIISELFTSYTYSSGNLVLFMKPDSDHATNTYKAISSYNYSSGTEKPKLILYSH